MDWNAHTDALSKRRDVHSALVHTQSIEGFGGVSRFKRPGGEDVVLVESNWGGHNLVGLQDSVVDVIGKMFFGFI